MMISILVLVSLAWLVPVILLFRGFGGRPRPERFLAVNGFADRPSDVDHVRTILRRTYRSRLAGAIAGLTIGGLAALRVSPMFVSGGAIIGLLMGSMVGITVAQARRGTTDRSAARSASLLAREPRDYRPRHAAATITVLAVMLLAYGIFAVTSAQVTLGVANATIFGVGFAALLAVPLGQRFERRTAELQRTGGDETARQVDDALRASAIRGIHHSTLGVLLCGLCLIGTGAVATQSWIAVVDGPHTLLRIPSHTTVNLQRVSQAGTPAAEAVWRADWKEFDGTSHARTLRPASGNVTLDSSGRDSSLLGIGAAVSFLGFLGALIEWVRAARAWRKPQRGPTLPLVAPSVAPTNLGVAR